MNNLPVWLQIFIGFCVGWTIQDIISSICRFIQTINKSYYE